MMVMMMVTQFSPFFSFPWRVIRNRECSTTFSSLGRKLLMKDRPFQWVFCNLISAWRVNPLFYTDMNCRQGVMKEGVDDQSLDINYNQSALAVNEPSTLTAGWWCGLNVCVNQSQPENWSKQLFETSSGKLYWRRPWTHLEFLREERIDLTWSRERKVGDPNKMSRTENCI